jgi:hypothetical protein
MNFLPFELNRILTSYIIFDDKGKITAIVSF